MTLNTRPLLRLLCSRSLAAIAIVAALAMTILLPADGDAWSSAHGFGLPSPDKWIADPVFSLGAAVVCQLLIVMSIMLINKAFNLLRGLNNSSLMWSALFMLFQGADPSAGRFGSGYLLAMIILLSIGVFYGIYQIPSATRRVFCIFLMMGAGSLVADCFIPFIPVMMLGCFQMRVFSLRAFIALMAGLFVPPWLLWASGLWTPEFTLPDISIFPAAGALMTLIYPVALGMVTLALGFVSGSLDMVHVYGRNAKTRARFGLMAVTGIMAGLLAVVDFGDIEAYTPLLNVTTAYFITLLFSFSPRNTLGSGGVVMSLSILLFIVLYAWRLILIFA